MDTQHNLIDLFNQYFEVVSADTPEKLRECYRLRYEVYCTEGIIPGFHPDDYPEGLEQDPYDERSVHCLLIHKPSGCIAGTVRLILPIPGKCDDKFPIEEHAGDSFYPDIISFNNISRARLGEISRLILSPKFRARKGESRHPDGVAEDNEYLTEQNGTPNPQVHLEKPGPHRNDPRRVFPHAILGLFVAIVRMSVEQNLTYWYGGMEPVCARFLRSFGIDFTPIGPIVDYYGSRRSYFGSVPDIMENIYRVNSQVWALLTENGALFPRPK